MADALSKSLDAPDEILVSELTRALAGASGLSFEDRGTHALKGLEGQWHLFAYVGAGTTV